MFYEEKRLEIGAILRDLCRWKGAETIEVEADPDHIHMPIPPKMSVSEFRFFERKEQGPGYIGNSERQDFSMGAGSFGFCGY